MTRKGLLLGLLLICACSENDSLTGSTWRLAGYVDVQTNELTKSDPDVDKCRDCYTIEFDTDSTAHGKSVSNDLWFHRDPSYLDLVFMTEIGDSHHGNCRLYYEAWRTTTHYEIEKNDMRIFYNDNKNYMLFKLLDRD